MTEHKVSRSYHAPVRTAQARATRLRVIEAAGSLFVSRGFSATTMREIAAAAGVSVQTVELAFGTKAGVLNEVVDVTTAGDDAPVPMLDRPWTDGLDEVSTEQLVNRYVRTVTEVAFRVAPLFAAIDQAAGDPQVSGVAQRLDRQRGVVAGWLIDRLLARGALAADLTRREAAEALVVLLDPGVHRRLIVQRSWSRARFRRWLERSILRLLVDDTGER